MADEYIYEKNLAHDLIFQILKNIRSDDEWIIGEESDFDEDE